MALGKVEQGIIGRGRGWNGQCHGVQVLGLQLVGALQGPPAPPATIEVRCWEEAARYLTLASKILPLLHIKGGRNERVYLEKHSPSPCAACSRAAISQVPSQSFHAFCPGHRGTAMLRISVHSQVTPSPTAEVFPPPLHTTHLQFSRRSVCNPPFYLSGTWPGSHAPKFGICGPSACRGGASDTQSDWQSSPCTPWQGRSLN